MSSDDGTTFITTADGRRVRVRKVSRAEAAAAGGASGPGGRRIVRRVVRRVPASSAAATNNKEEDEDVEEEEEEEQDGPEASYEDEEEDEEEGEEDYEEEVVDDTTNNGEGDDGFDDGPIVVAPVVAQRKGLAAATMAFDNRKISAPTQSKFAALGSRRGSMSAIPTTKSSMTSSAFNQNNHTGGSAGDDEDANCLLVNRTYYSKPVFVARFKLPVILIQAWVRGCMQRKRYYGVRNGAATLIACHLRTWLMRRKFQRILRHVRNGGSWDNSLTCWAIGCSISAKTLPPAFLQRQRRLAMRRSTAVW